MNKTIAKQAALTADMLQTMFHYDPETGHFIRLINSANTKAGDRAGTTNSKGYRIININYRLYLEHRLAWFYMTGEWPKNQIDHINENKADNRFENLREATNAENQKRKPAFGKTSVFKGVQFSKSMKKWQAKTANAKRLYFDSETDAAICYNYHAAYSYGEFSRLNEIDRGGYIHE